MAQAQFVTAFDNPDQFDREQITWGGSCADLLGGRNQADQYECEYGPRFNKQFLFSHIGSAGYGSLNLLMSFVSWQPRQIPALSLLIRRRLCESAPASARSLICTPSSWGLWQVPQNTLPVTISSGRMVFFSEAMILLAILASGAFA